MGQNIQLQTQIELKGINSDLPQGDQNSDATKTFNAVGHSTFALKEMERYYIQQHDGLKKMESGL